MEIKKVKTRKITPPKDSLEDLLAHVPRLEENSIIAISSKVISICEGQTIPLSEISHDDLVDKLATLKIEPTVRSANDMILTQVGNILVESAGVDVSNANGYYVLLPKNPYKSAKQIWDLLRKRDKLRKLGVVITDSHAVPRRKGAIGFALASYGFKATRVYDDKRDVFGHTFRFTATDVADSLAAAATLVMGEGDERTPIALITGLSNVQFFRKALPLQTARRYSWVHPSLDVYAPLLDASNWQKTNIRKKTGDKQRGGVKHP